MDSMQLDPETVDNLDAYSHIPPQLMEKCAALSVRPDTVRNLVQSMQVLSGVFTDVEASLKDIKDLLGEDELLEQKFQEAMGQVGASTAVSKAELAEVRREWAKYMEVHEKASFTNSELHRAMNLHVSNLRLLSGPLDQVRAALPTPALSPGEHAQPVSSLRRRVGGAVASLPAAAPRGQGCAAEPEAYPGQGAGDAGPARVSGAAAAGAHPEGRHYCVTGHGGPLGDEGGLGCGEGPTAAA